MAGASQRRLTRMAMGSVTLTKFPRCRSLARVTAMTGAKAGSGDGEYDESGAFLTGGLWDKLPAKGDAVLNGLVPEEDNQAYP